MYHIGIDLGGTNIACGVVDDNNKIVGRGKIKTDRKHSDKEIILDMAAAAKMAVENAGLKLSDITDYGVACPGTVDPEKGMVIYANNLNFRNSVIIEGLSKELGLKGYIDNDANAAAYGELLAGSGMGAKDFIAITLGTGVGGGIIIGGKIYSGFNYAGAELGHMSIAFDGEPCNCGNKGCLEAYASATALIRQTKEAMEKDHSSKMWEVAGNLENVDGCTAFDAMNMGDKTAADVVDRYISYLACGVTNLINIFQPEFVCIGGGISHSGDDLLIPLREKVNRCDYNRDATKKTKICCASLGNDAGIIGASNLYRL